MNPLLAESSSAEVGPSGHHPRGPGHPARASVDLCQAADHAEWDEYVRRHPQASFFHQIGWMKAVRDHYGHRPRYLLARDPDQRICGVLPLFEVTSPLTGRALISTPYAVSGGAAADSDGLAELLNAAARQHAESSQVRYLELRNRASGIGFLAQDHYYNFRTNLPADPGLVLNRFPRKARAEIRKARDQFHLEARFGAELFHVFYGLYLRSLRRLGSPGHSYRFLRRLVDEFRDDCLVQVVSFGRQPVAGVLSFRFRDQILPYFAGIDGRFNQFNSSNFLYFSLMEHAVGLGLRVFDFGRTRRDNVGGCQFKINQGFDPEPLPYTFFSPRGIDPPNLRPSNPAFSWSQRAWRRLPLAVTGPLGGRVTRWFP